MAMLESPASSAGVEMKNSRAQLQCMACPAGKFSLGGGWRRLILVLDGATKNKLHRFSYRIFVMNSHQKNHPAEDPPNLGQLHIILSLSISPVIDPPAQWTNGPGHHGEFIRKVPLHTKRTTFCWKVPSIDVVKTNKLTHPEYIPQSSPYSRAF